MVCRTEATLMRSTCQSSVVAANDTDTVRMASRNVTTSATQEKNFCSSEMLMFEDNPYSPTEHTSAISASETVRYCFSSICRMHFLSVKLNRKVVNYILQSIRIWILCFYCKQTCILSLVISVLAESSGFSMPLTFCGEEK